MIHLLCEYYLDDVGPTMWSWRQMEIDEALRQNNKNRFIDHIHTFADDSLDLTRFGPNIIHHKTGSRATFQAFIDYAKGVIPSGDTCIIANSDIVFDETLGLLNQISLIGRCLALTRYDVESNGEIVLHPDCDSCDSWIFLNPIFASANYYLGILGCDNNFVIDLRATGMRVYNPCRSIRTLHLHASGRYHINSDGRRPGMPLKSDDFRTPGITLSEVL